MAFTRTSASRRLLALLALLTLIAVSSTSSWNALPAFTGVAGIQQAGTTQPPKASLSTGFGYAYPAENQSSLAASAALAESVLDSLGLTNLTSMIFNTSASPEDLQNQTYLPDGSYVNGPVVRYSSGAAWASFRYSPGGHFLGLSVVNAAPAYSGPSDADKTASTESIATALGLPLSNNSTWNIAHEPVFLVLPVSGWRNQTVVEVRSSETGLNLTPANSLTVRFMDYAPYAAIRLDVSAWFVADWSTMLPTNALELSADEYVRSQNETRNWTIQSIREVGLVPFPDEGTFGLLFSLRLSNTARLAEAMVYVGAWTGLVLRWSFQDLSHDVESVGTAAIFWLEVMALVAAAGLVAFGALFRGVESVRYGTLLLAARLLAFVERAEVDNFARGQILGCIVAVPGITYSQLSKKLGIANGVLTYHLSVLEKEGFVRPRRVGVHKCFYPSGWKEPAVEPMVLSQLQRRVLELVRQQPGISPGEVATRLTLHRRNASYNIGRLANMGFLEVTRHGRKKSCRLAVRFETADTV